MMPAGPTAKMALLRRKQRLDERGLATEFWIQKARSWRAPSGSSTGAGHPGVSQMVQRRREQQSAKAAVSIFHQDTGPGNKLRRRIRITHEQSTTDDAGAMLECQPEADSGLNAAAIELSTCASIMYSAAFQPGSSANDFSITSCSCRRSAALTRLKRNCLGALIAGNFVSAKSKTKF